MWIVVAGLRVNIFSLVYFKLLEASFTVTYVVGCAGFSPFIATNSVTLTFCAIVRKVNLFA